MSNTEQVIAVLEGAKRVLMEDGWIQGDYHNDGGHCTIGALRVGAGLWVNGQDLTSYYHSMPELLPKRQLVAEVIEGFMEANDLDHPDAGIGTWNDEKGRTEAQVLGALDNTILYVKETYR